MYKIILIILVIAHQSQIYANSIECGSKVSGYRVVKGSVYSFMMDELNACFFAFYTNKVYPMLGRNGDGNNEDAIWFGYFLKNKPNKIYEFPKPTSDPGRDVCSIKAVAFLPMYGDGRRDVTVIGSCDRKTTRKTYAFVFNRRGKLFVLDDQLFMDLSEIYDLTIRDVQNFIRSPGYIIELRRRYGHVNS